MNRADLERMTLDELYRVAAERGLREAPGLPREVVIERLLGEAGARAVKHGEHAVKPMENGTQHPVHTPLHHEHKPPHADREHHRGDPRHAPGAPPGRPAAMSPSEKGTGAPRVRGAGHDGGIPSSVAPDRPSEHEPDEMARLYLEQGEYQRAADLYRELLLVRPDDESLVAGLAAAEGKLREHTAYAAGEKEVERPHPRHDGEPTSMLDLEEPPDAYGVDECEVIAQNPHFLFVYWEVTEGGLAAARRDLGEEAGGARLVLRVFATAGPGERGPEREWRDHHLDWNHGRRYLPAPRSGARVRAAVGLLTPSGLFAPIAHSSQVRVPPAEPSSQIATEWMEVEPARSRGLAFEGIRIVERGPGTGERGLFGPGAGRGGPGTGGEAQVHEPRGGSSPTSPWRWRPGSQS